MRNLQKFSWVLLLGMLLLVMLSMGSALAAANTVPVSGASEENAAVTVEQLAPPECAGITLQNLVIGSTRVRGSGANDLILGSAGNDDLTGRNGSDCLVGGAGNDTLSGGQRDDVLIGGPGNDSLDGGAGTDTCYGGSGTNTLVNCELP